MVIGDHGHSPQTVYHLAQQSVMQFMLLF